MVVRRKKNVDENSVKDRRLFLKGVAALTASVTVLGSASRSGAQEVASNEAKDDSPKGSDSSKDLVRIGIMGVNGRGSALANGFMSLPDVSVDHLCDVDSRALDRAVKIIVEKQGQPPQTTGDIRQMLDNKQLDVLVVAAPNHWHAPATVLGCAAGKHVYVEKPCSHTAEEGELAVAAARRHQRVVQMGSQRRSWPAIREAIDKLRKGDIGELLYARSWYNNRRGPIGVGKEVEVPSWLDWNLWQGPAPRVPYRDNIVHYNWHWHWDWGNGELGNNGVHGLDVARWGMDVTYPMRVSAGGGKYRYEDDQQTPDTMMVTCDFPGKKTITWEGLSWSSFGPHDSQFGVSFHGTNGSMVIHDPGYSIFDQQNKLLSTHTDRGGDQDHLSDFLSAVRTGGTPHADIEEAHRSTLLCHLGNIAYRTSTTLQTDTTNGHILNSAEAAALWSREYAEGWKPVV